MVKQCPKCGAANRDDATFCSSCGSSFAAPAVKPVPSVKVVRPAVPSIPYRVPPPGMCYYHPNLPAQYICSRCGRAICRDDARFYGDLVLCPQCYAGIVPVQVPQYPPAYPGGYPAVYPTAGYPPQAPMPVMGAPLAPPPAAYPPAPPGPPGFPAPPPMPLPLIPVRPSATWGFILSLIAGIIAIVAGAAATAVLYINLPVVPAWLSPYVIAFLGVGLLLGLVVILGAFLIRLGYTTLGGIIAFVFSLANIYIALLIVVPTLQVYAAIVAGIVALILGMVGGILGILGK
ncbi:zinc ribbon domain-containing protein [Candidatus Bathyarchaeota archaeon]|nr:zinc ribbon domain-containing protein [Candidatus Bathyarchaeota archaeon]